MRDDRYFEKLGEEIIKTFYDEAEKLAEKIGLILERETKDVLKQNDKIATADLYKSIREKTRKMLWGYMITVFSNVNYAQYVYDGTKPHFPPINKIAKWVRIKKLSGNYSIKSHGRLGKKQDQYDQDRALAWLIARKIAKKGTKGIKFFDLALKQGLPMIEQKVANFKG